MQKEYVNIGCGMSAGKGWRNYDASPTLRFERTPLLGKIYTKNATRFPKNIEYGNIIKGLPLPPGSCRVIYSSHMLEHLALADFRVAIHNVYTYLEKGGLFRLVVPDLEYFISEYTSSTSDDAAMAFMRKTFLGVEERPSSLFAFISSWLGNTRHYWMWDYKSFKKELGSAGFCDIRRACFGDNKDPMLEEVEDKGRWDDCLGIECKKMG